MFIYVLILVTVLLVSCKAINRKRQLFQNLPKGPTGLPIIGNILQLGRKPHLTLSKWAEKLGHLYTIDLLGKPALVINDLETMKDLFGNPNSTGRYESITIDIIHGANYGLVNTEGRLWYEQRKFFTKVLRQFGLHGGNQLTETLLKECKDLCNWMDNDLKENKNGLVYLDKVLLHSVANIVWNAVTGEQHTSYKNIAVTLLDKAVKQFNDSSVLIFMPWLRFIAPEKTGWNQLVKKSDEFHKHIRNCFDKRKLAKKSCTDINTPLNVMEAYIHQVESCRDIHSSFYGENGMKHSLFAVVNLLLGGSETTSSNLKWLIHYLLVYPDVQRKLQAEVDAVIQEEGENFGEIDKARLPYLEAVILEVLRISCLVPLGVIQRLLDDVTYEGFSLPKGTFLLANIYHANMNSNVWKDPKTFRPERFLEGSETERKRLKDCVVSFQEGRRKCPGEHAARHMTFWYIFYLVAKYSFHKDENKSAKEYLEPVSGFLLLPPQLGVVIKARNNN